MSRPAILIIEDSPAQAAAISEIVNSLGFEPLVHHKMPDDLGGLLASDSPQMVLLDLRLLDETGASVGDGFQICKEIKRLKSDLPVLVVSSEPVEQAGEWAKLQGADGFLQKPFLPEDLGKLIKEMAPK